MHQCQAGQMHRNTGSGRTTRRARRTGINEKDPRHIVAADRELIGAGPVMVTFLVRSSSPEVSVIVRVVPS
jgi:hypothetical protein